MKSLLFDSVTDARQCLAQLSSVPAGVVAVVPAAGVGERSGLSIPKQYAPLAGQIMLARSIQALLRSPRVSAVLVVLSPDDRHWQSLGLDQALAFDPRVVAVRVGGASRRDSVINGLQLLLASGARPESWVMVHDAARPGLTESALARLIEAAGQACLQGDAGAILGLPVADTLKRETLRETARESQSPTVSTTLDRQGVWAAHTPQMFQLQPLSQALAGCPDATDEASAIERSGGRVRLVPSEMGNFKVTQPQDFHVMEALMCATQTKSSRPQAPFAVGQGFDVHALVEGRPLILGGVVIPFEKGLAGHSDADVLLHAITDAILGAAGLGDIGRHFPDSDAAYRGADSAKLLSVAVGRVHEAGWRVAQVDATIVAQAPKISPFAPQMQRVIGECCGVSPESVNIKGKTTEGLGFTGRGEGIAAQAVAMLVRQSD